MPNQKKKPRPWDRSEEDIPDVIWGGHPKPSDNPEAKSGVLNPFSRYPLPQMDQPV